MAAGDDSVRSSTRRFFKEDVKAYGVKAAEVSKIGGKYLRQVRPLGKEKVFSLCEELLKSGVLEESILAFKWADKMSKEFGEGDFELFEMWLSKYVSNWASCDTLCNHAVGTFVEMYPEYVVRLKSWTASPNRWVRRGSAVSLILPARKGLFLNDVFEISSLLMGDGDDLVQKGFGWLLKEAGKKHTAEVFDYVIANRHVMPRTALRYSVELMPARLRKEAMKK